MKKVIMNNELKEKIMEAIDLLCPPVKSTLGPKGNNVIIDHSNFSPFITNDGVTIARNIESDDEAVNTILEFIKEASIATDESVGDGTTTTIVLLEAIYKEGLKLVENGINPIILKEHLDLELENIINEIKKNSKIPTEENLLNVATIAGGNKEIGKTVFEVFSKIKNKNAINITTSDNYETTIIYENGYILDTSLASQYYYKDDKSIKVFNIYTLLTTSYLDDINQISSIINYITSNNKELLLIADNYSDNFIEEIIDLYINQNIKIYLIKNPEYGDNRYKILKDLEVITNAKTLENIDLESPNYLGISKNINFEKGKITISFDTNKNISKRIARIKNEEDGDFKEKRIAMFESGLATILIGGKTTSETRELKMRYDDALCAINSAKDGIIPGCGIILLKISNELSNDNFANLIFKSAFKNPFTEIMNNSGLNINTIISEIEFNNFETVYNVITNKFENIKNTSVIDSTNVLINSLKNACTIASMLLTTNSLVINEYQNNLNKINDYNEL